MNLIKICKTIVVFVVLIIYAVPIANSSMLSIHENIVNLSAFNSPPEIEWSKTYGDTGGESGSWVQQTLDEGYIIAGSKTPEGMDNSDILVIKTDKNGNIEWNKNYGGNGDETASSIFQTSDGNYIIIGNTKSYGSGGSDAWIIKLNSNGNKIWSKTVGNENSNSIEEGWPTNDNGFILVGTTEAGIGTDIWLVKIDSSGEAVWQKTYDKSTYDAGLSVQQTNDGGYIILGTFSKLSYSNSWLIKTNQNGGKIEENALGDQFVGAIFAGQSICKTSGGGYVVAGYCNEPFSLFDFDYYIWKISSGLKIEDETSVEKTNDKQMFFSVRSTSSGGFILVGNNLDTQDIDLIKINSDLDVDWLGTFGGGDIDMGFFAEETEDFGYILVGVTLSYGAGNGDVWLIKLEGSDNHPPDKPNKPKGPDSGAPGEECVYSTETIDLDNDDIFYKFDWGDGYDSGWIGPETSGVTITAKKTWSSTGKFSVKVIAKDVNGAESEWSDSLIVSMPKSKFFSISLDDLILQKIMAFLY